MSCGLSHKFFNVYETVPKVHYQAWQYSKVKLTVTVKLSLSTPWRHVKGKEIHLQWFLTSSTRWR